MNTKQFEGKINQLQGDVKMAVGHTVKSQKLEQSGAKDKLKGLLQEEIGDAQEKINEQVASAKTKSKELKEEIHQKSEEIADQIKEKLNKH